MAESDDAFATITAAFDTLDDVSAANLNNTEHEKFRDARDLLYDLRQSIAVRHDCTFDVDDHALSGGYD